MDHTISSRVRFLLRDIPFSILNGANYGPIPYSLSRSSNYQLIYSPSRPDRKVSIIFPGWFSHHSWFLELFKRFRFVLHISASTAINSESQEVVEIISCKWSYGPTYIQCICPNRSLILSPNLAKESWSSCQENKLCIHQMTFSQMTLMSHPLELRDASCLYDQDDNATR